MGIFSDTSTEWLFVHCFQVELEIGNVGFCGGRKTGVPREKSLKQEREPTTNSTHIWREHRESNPGHIGGTFKVRLLSFLRSSVITCLSLVSSTSDSVRKLFVSACSGMNLFPPSSNSDRIWLGSRELMAVGNLQKGISIGKLCPMTWPRPEVE